MKLKLCNCFLFFWWILPQGHFAQSSTSEEKEKYYQFHISYNHPDSFSYENYYYLREKDFWSFDQKNRQFNAFPGDIFENAISPIGKLNNEAGIGLLFSNSRSAHPGYPVRVLEKEYSSTNIFDTSAVSVIALGISKGNATEYEYRMMLNNRDTVLPWTDFTVFRKIQETGYSYAVVGDFLFPGNYLLIEIRHKKTLQDAGSVILNWPRFPELKIEHSRIYFKEDNAIGSNGYQDAALLRNNYATGKDSRTGVLKNLNLPGDREYLSFIFDLSNMEITFPYSARLVRNTKGNSDTLEIDSYFSRPTVKIPAYFLDQPGEYQLLLGCNIYFFYPEYSHHILSVPFTISPVPFFSIKWTLFEILPVIAGLIIVFSIAFYAYHHTNRRKIKQVEQEKKLKILQLRSLQDQLNPHFLFNALSAIQNLVAKGDMENASHYLHRFSLLTRTILANSRQEMISLEDELQILSSYLEMEQLRTPFSFEISLDENIHTGNVEIPVMLLQPFVENAVKHGVNSLNGGGYIKLNIIQQNTALAFSIKDNGTGIPNEKEVINSKGWGLDVLQKRVALLNEIYGVTVIEYEILSDNTGTEIKLQLKNWLN